jgi:diguanylate cyclase (GGDEF)-like protein
VRAASDVLTGLPNRRAAEDTLARMAANAGRSENALAAVLIDVDYFKQINDVHGHAKGDQALVAVSQILASTIRASDFVARYGGEEFLVLLPDTNRAGAFGLAEKLRSAISRIKIDGIDPITASFGIAIRNDDASDTGRVMREADRALYGAKADGRNCVRAIAGNSLVSY